MIPQGMAPTMGPQPMHVNIPFGIPPIVNAAMGYLAFCDERKCPSWLAAWGQGEGSMHDGTVPVPIMERLNQLNVTDKDDRVRSEALNVLLKYFNGEQNYTPEIPEGVKEMVAQNREQQAPRPGPGPHILGAMRLPPEVIAALGDNVPDTPDEWIQFWEWVKTQEEGPQG